MAQPSPDRRQPGGEPLANADSSSAGLEHASAIDAVVRTTLELADGGEKASLEEVAALREVASRYGPADLVLDPVAIELVAGIIKVNYGALNRQPEFWQAVAEKIAAVLFESPAAKARLENLWRRLGESNAQDA
jgi:hypothetical protein